MNPLFIAVINYCRHPVVLVRRINPNSIYGSVSSGSESETGVIRKSGSRASQSQRSSSRGSSRSSSGLSESDTSERETRGYQTCSDDGD